LRIEPLDAGAAVDADYLTVGHVTIDVLADGTRLPGGAALYGALLASRCGLAATILTAGDPATLAAAVEPLADDVRVLVDPAPTVTTLATAGAGGKRTQRVVERAADIAPRPVGARVLHIAPVVREVGEGWAGAEAELVGLTAQGLVRRWDDDGLIKLYGPPGLASFAADVTVLGEVEEPYCRPLLDANPPLPLVVVTREARPATVLVRGEKHTVPAIRADARSDIGAGDVFAAALLVSTLEGTEPGDAVRFAHAAAAARVGGPEGPAGVPDRTAIDAVLAAAR
jgi:1D-myo-inositol 3-kinase